MAYSCRERLTKLSVAAGSWLGRIGNRNGRHIEQRMNQHQHEKRPEFIKGQLHGVPVIVYKPDAKDRGAADQMADREKFLRREIAIRELITEEQRRNRRDGEGVHE